MLKALILTVMMMVSSHVWAQAELSELLQLKAEVQELKAQLKLLQEKKLQCTDGKSVQGPLNKWSPWSVCPEGMTATGLGRVDIQGNHEAPTNHVNDFQCGDKGCRAWCIGNPCEVIARCCK
ncbi:MAG: hypothetical protein EOP07_26575 [Proteobacteria bacterium]|nr:MAG: hypothetical protein EOP07_26575 [Pseudomonadota bacterium]